MTFSYCIGSKCCILTHIFGTKKIQEPLDHWGYLDVQFWPVTTFWNYKQKEKTKILLKSNLFADFLHEIIFF